MVSNLKAVVLSTKSDTILVANIGQRKRIDMESPLGKRWWHRAPEETEDVMQRRISSSLSATALM